MDQFKIVVSVVHNKKISRSADKQQRNTNEKTGKKGPKTKRHLKTVLLSEDIKIHTVNQSSSKKLV